MIIEHAWNLSFDTCTNVVDVYVFGRWQTVDSVRNVVVALGPQRMRDIAVSCSVLTLLPEEKTALEPVVFWEQHFCEECGFLRLDLAQNPVYFARAVILLLAIRNFRECLLSRTPLLSPAGCAVKLETDLSEPACSSHPFKRNRFHLSCE